MITTLLTFCLLTSLSRILFPFSVVRTYDHNGKRNRSPNSRPLYCLRITPQSRLLLYTETARRY